MEASSVALPPEGTHSSHVHSFGKKHNGYLGRHVMHVWGLYIVGQLHFRKPLALGGESTVLSRICLWSIVFKILVVIQSHGGRC